MIRKAEPEDFYSILDLCEVFWQHTLYEEAFDRTHVLNMVEMAYDHGLLAVLVIEKEVVGFVAGIKSPTLGSPKALSGTELAWWVNPDHRKGRNGINLLKFIEQLAKEQGIKYWSMISMASSNPEAPNRIYGKMGYSQNEIVWTKVI